MFKSNNLSLESVVRSLKNITKHNMQEIVAKLAVSRTSDMFLITLKYTDTPRDKNAAVEGYNC